MLSLLLSALSALPPAALAAPLTYDEALAEALQKNAGVLGAEADRAAAEGSLLSAQGAWDPWLSASPYRSVTTSSGISDQLGIPYTYSGTTTGWSAGLSQTLATGTSWSLDWNASSSLSVVTTEIAGQTFEETDIGGYNSSLTLGLSQQLLQGWRMAYNLQYVQAAERALSATEIALRSARQDVLVQAANGYWDLVLARASAQAAERAVAAAAEQRRIVAAQVEVGNMAPIDLTRVEAALAQAKLTQIELEIARDAASDALAVLLGRPPESGIETTTAPGDAPMNLDLDVDAAIAAAMAGNPSIAAQKITLEGAELDLVNARHARLPSLTLNGQLGVNGFSELSYSEAFGQNLARDLPTSFIGADLSVPLMNRSDRGAYSSAAAAMTGAELDMDALERSVAQQTAAQVRSVQSARQRIELADLNLKLARETLAAEDARQSVGRAIQKDVLDAQNALFEAEIEVARARVQFRQAMVQLKALQGTL